MRFADWIDAFRPAEGPPPRTLLAFFRWCFAGAWPALGWAALISSAAGVLDVFSAMLLGKVIDTALTAGPQDVFTRHWPLLAFFVLFYMVLRPVVFGLSNATTSITIGPNLLPLVLSRLHRWTMGQAVTFFDNDFAGRIAQKQMQTARAATDVATEAINVVTFALSSLVGSALFLLAIDYRIALGLTIWLGFYLWLIAAFIPRVRARSAERAAARAMVTGQVVDTITNIKTVKLFAHAEFEDRSALTAMAGFREKALEFGLVATWFRVLLMTLAGVLPVVLVGGTILLWSTGHASAGDIAAAGAIALRTSQMTGWVSMALMSAYGSVGEVEDGMNTLAASPALADKPGAVPLTGPNTIEYRDVSFGYGRQSGGVQHLNLRIEEGEKLGIVGASGAGKSTMVALLLRLYDVEEGAVLVGGQDVRDVTEASLRRRIGMVTQETAMFNRSARDNILYGRPDATDDELFAAAEAAEAHDFITGLEDFKGRTGYGAHLGERGVKLSGGQRQRIALARAILKDAPILILDEATSALDSEVEAEIQQALDQVMQGKTVLAIAHRLSTLMNMDRIIVLDSGRIVEQGSHADLLDLNGLYARYWNRQSGGFLGTAEAAE